MNIKKLKRSFAALILVVSGSTVLNAQTNADTAVPGALSSTNAVSPAEAGLPAGTNAPAVIPVPDTLSGTNAAAPAVAGELFMDNPLVITNAPKATPGYRPLSISLEAGLFSGGGAGLSWRMASHLGIRGGVDYLSYSTSGNAEFSGSEISGTSDYDITLRTQSEYLALDLYPSRKSSFHFSLGAVFEQSEYKAKAEPTGGTITIDGEEYTVIAGGNIRLKINRPDVCPYVSIGGNFFIGGKKHWSMGYEIGASYGKWDVALNSSGIDDPSGTLETDLKEARNDINDALNKFPVWPILKLNLSYAF